MATDIDSQIISEASPLLPSLPASLDSNGPTSPGENKQAKCTIWVGILIIFLLSGSSFLIIAPITQLKELAICKKYYGSIWEPGSDCKVELIQSELASLIGVQQFLDCLPGARRDLIKEDFDLN